MGKAMANRPQENPTMLCDFYELTMGNGYYRNGFYKRNVYFDVFFRNVPDGGGFAIAAGLEQIVEYIQQLHFSDDDIAYLRGKGIFDEGFLTYLKNFKFHGDIYAVPEGTPVFPGEPLLTVRAPAIEAQLIETYLLLEINHQSLIATKANRIVRAAQGRAVLEFGSRRAQGADGAVIGARAAYIGGVAGTACTLTDVLYGVPAGGTMAHSWVQMFPTEYDAFKTYCELYPDNATLLVDTYNTLKSGVPNAIRAFKEILLPRGITNFAIRLDSGDISYLSKKARKMLDEAGLPNCKITASNSLDEYLIRDLMMQGAQVDTFGVGERLITSKSNPVFGGVYKLAAIEDDEGNIIPKIKVSENTAKITNPHFKRLYRLYDRESGKAIADELTLRDEVIDPTKPHVIFDPNATWKTKELTDFTVRELQVPIFQNGELVYELPELNDEYVASKTDFKTVEELRANYKERMQKAAEANAKAEYEHELIDLAVANAKFSVPEIMIEDKISQMVEEMKMSLESRKMSLDMYMQYTGLDMAKIRENQRPVAEENVKTDLVLDAIAKAEDIQVDMADVDAEIAAISAQHGASPEEVKKIIKGNGTMGLLLANILRRKAAHVVIDSAK